MSFLPISILAYVLNAGAILVDKILIKKSFPSPMVYTFYVNVLQLLVLLLIPFGFQFSFGTPAILAILSGIISVAALYAFFTSLRENEASTVGPVVGTLNPLFALILGGIFLNQILNPLQYIAFLIILLGTLVLTFNLWSKKLAVGSKLLWMVLAGAVFGLSYVLLREAFLSTSFINGLIISRATSGVVALSLLAVPAIRSQVLIKSPTTHHAFPAFTLLAFGQIMGAASGLLITFGVYLANPALVNSVFGIQYLTILIVALILSKNHPQLLDETLTKSVIVQKITGALMLSIGLYLLSQ